MRHHISNGPSTGRAIRSTRLVGLLVAVAALAASCVPPDPSPVDPNFQTVTAISGLDLPTSVRFAQDGRVFVAERAGRLLAYDSLEDTSPTMVTSLSNRVSTMWDRGFMGIELDPAFTSGRPYIYALYSYNAPPGGTHPAWLDGCFFAGFGNNGTCGITTGQLMRITVGPDNVAVSQTVLITDWCQQFGGHSVNDLEFGADGSLFVSGGEGANFETPDWGQFHGNPCGDPELEGGMLRSQDARTTDDPTGLNGTVIRIDPDTGDAWPTNPWAGDPDPNRARIVGYGFRNPFRLSLDPSTESLYVADVGWNLWEEVNRIDLASGEVPNFGWPCFEGDARQPLVDAAELPLCQSLGDDDVTAPTYAYSHSDTLGANCGTGGTSVTGLATVTDHHYPAPYDDGLFMADYSRSCIWFVPRANDGSFDFAHRRSFATNASAVDLQVGPGGDIFFVDTVSGTVRRIISTGTNGAPVAHISADHTSGDAPLTVALSAAGSTDPDGDPLTASWDLDDDGLFDDATGTAASVTLTENGSYRVRVRVSDPSGAAAVDELTIVVGNTAPTATIELPLGGAYSPGEQVPFSGSATDPEDGPLPASALTWVFTIQHCDTPSSCHEHQVGTIVGVAAGTFEMPNHPQPSFLDVELTAVDSSGAGHTVLRQIEIGP